jgi:Ran GTPase-activating protein (RanGAP) involved in mRNA processing and transport
VLVQCEEEDEEDEDEDEEVAAVDQEEEGVSTLAYQCSVCRHLPPVLAKGC